MMLERKLLILTAAFLLMSFSLSAQQVEERDTVGVFASSLSEKKNRGRLTGSIETNSIIYQSDAITGAVAPNFHYGSNNYVKLDYRLGRFSAGVQAEYYPQALQGFEQALTGFRLPEKYASWTGKQFSVTVGDYYEQFGSGLLFRSWEDRTLGLNNSIGGAKITFNIEDYVRGKLIYGFPRDYMGKGQGWMDTYTNTQIFGGDISLSLSNLFGLENHNIALEGSVLYRLENDIPPVLDNLGLGLDKGNVSYSARMSYEVGGFSFKGEYVGKEEDLFLSPKIFDYELRAGNAQYVEIGYAGGGFSAVGMFRRLDQMRNLVYRTLQNPLQANTLNYIPALSPQHTYMLATLNPYSPNVNGEVGGQVDLFYLFKKNTKLGGKRGWKLHTNFSLYYSLESAVERDLNPFLFRNVSVDAEKNWNKKLKTILYVTIQEYAADHGTGVSALTVAQNVFVADALYKFSSKMSLRGELQYLYSEETTRDWMAALLELGIGSKWSVFVSDMYNHGDTKVHYYSAGASYTHSMVRVSVNYGRNRAGYVCSSGVCRYQPAYTGLNLAMSVLF